ncbi:uncharacterized protein LOC125208611 [Salvia hispanica]|uniref:uncharacterized protein LOC125208611 n=1 Tax=Salvia hispanica TaxID=49212 RepID=UPI002009087B|nr:uncharacterized protein LOC125208611 [Salvia hispanica]
MASNFPRYIIMTLQDEGYYLYHLAVYKGEADGIVSCAEDKDLSAYIKIEVEPAIISKDYFHLRHTRTNKYWGRNDEGLLVANNTFRDEDTRSPGCTLFEPTDLDQDGGFNLKHVHTGHLVRRDGARFSIKDDPSSEGKLRYVDWETIVKLPTDGLVAFQGDNGKYLQAFSKDGHQYLQFSSNEPNHVASAYSISPFHNGDVTVHAKADSLKFWSASPNWLVLIQQTSESYVFKPVKVGDNSIALFNNGAKRFCSRVTAEGLTDCFNANATSILSTARLVVRELVQERQIYGVEYNMGIGSISDEHPYIAGKSVVVNNSPEEAIMAVEITYQDEKSYTFSRGLSITAGVSTTIQTGVPFIANGSIEISLEISGALQWDETTTTTTSVTASTSVIVPAFSAVDVSYVGTKGTCTIPFSYTQQDKSSFDGTITRVRKDDGSYSGVSCYNFNFKVEGDSTLKLSN